MPAQARSMISLLLLLLCGSSVDAFAPLSARLLGRHLDLHDGSPKTKLFVFERMSEDCIACLVTAQEQAALLGLTVVGPEVLIAGCLDKPSGPL
jgi:hypothetical protein